MRNSKETLLALVIKNKGDWEKCYQELQSKKKMSEEEIDYYCSLNHDNFITILDSEYPEELKQSYRPPFVLFYKGNIELLKKPKRLLIISNGASSVEDKDGAIEILNNCDTFDTYLLGKDEYFNSLLLSKLSKRNFIRVLDCALSKSQEDAYSCKDKYLEITEIPENASKENRSYSKNISSSICTSALVLAVKSENDMQLGVVLMADKAIGVIPVSSKTKNINNKLIDAGMNAGVYIVYDNVSLQQLELKHQALTH